MAIKSLKQAVKEAKTEAAQAEAVIAALPKEEHKKFSVDYVKLAETQIRAAFAVRPVSTVSQKNSFASSLALDLYKKGLLKG